MQPCVTVVVPAYNHGRFLPETLGCLIRQTHQDWECVVVDDGSTDDTHAVVHGFSRIDPRIRYQHQDNRGLSAARNAGLMSALGRYVQFLDADDLLAEEKLERGVAWLDTHADVDVCYCNYRPMDSATGQLQECWTREMLGPDPLADFLYRWELDLCIPIHCALFRRSVWRDKPAFDEHLRAKEDWMFWVDLALRQTRFHFLDQDHAFYRMHDGNMFKRHGEMTPALVAATMRILLRTPPAYQQGFMDASLVRVVRSVDRWIAQDRAERAAAG
jgi:glycosyltransferase involved in cell wall biosynthesis